MSEIVNTAEIRVVADASGVEAGLRPAVDAAQRTERAITNIGAGSARSQQNLIQAIQRTTAEMEAGSRTGARYFEVLAQQRGIDPGVIQPYLQQLRAVQEAQQGAGQSAGQTANALRQVPAQMTDIITSLQGGMEPLTVLIQQGGQIRDAFGGIGPAARALGGQLMALVNPYTLVAAAMAAVAVLYLDSVQSADAYTRAIGETGNAAGVTTDQLSEMARALGKGDAAEALIGLTKASQVSAENIQRFAFIAIESQRVLGKAVEETVEEFDALGGDPAKALADLNGKYHFLTAEVYAQVKALEEQGKAAEAATMAQLAYADGMEKQRYKVLDSLSDWERGWLRIKKAAGDAIDATLGIASASTNAQQITSLLKDRDRIEENIATARARRDTYSERQQQALLDQNKAQINAIRARTDAEKAAAKAEADAAALNEARMKWDDQADAFLGKKAKLEQEITKARNEGAAAGASQAEIEERIGLIRKKYEPKDTGDAARKAAAERREEARLLAELSGVTGTYLEDLSRLNGVYAKGNLSQERYVELVTELISKQPGAKKMIDETAKEMADYAKATTAANEVLDKELDAITKQIQATSDSNDQIGLSKIAIAELEAARLEALATRKEENADIALGTDLTGRQSEIYLEQAQALRTLAAAKRTGAERQVAADSAKQAADDWKKASQEIEKSITDGLMRGFESGKGFGENLIDTLKNMFKTLILRPIISAVVNPVAGAASSMMGMPNVASAASSSGSSSPAGSLLSGAGMIGSYFGAGGLAGSVAAGAGWLTGATTLGGSLTAAGSLAATGTLGGIASSMGMVVGALGPIALGIGAAVAIWKKLDTSGTYHAGGAASATSAGVHAVSASSLNMEKIQTNAATQKMVGELAQGVVGILDSTALAFGKTAGYQAATAFADDTSKDGAWGSLVISKMGQSIVNWQDTRGNGKWSQKTFANGDQGQEQYLAALTSSVRTALNSIGLPDWARTMLSGVASDATLEDLAKVVDQINQTQQALGAMRSQLTGFASLSDTAVSALMAAAGGIEKLFANASSYYDAFYTEAEKNRTVNEQIAKQLAAVNLQMPATKEGFRALVEAQMALGTQGAESVSVLLGVAGAFAQLHPEVEAVTKDLSAQRSALTDAYNAESDALQSTISRMGNFATSLRNLGKSALLGGLSPLSPAQKYAEARAQYEQVAAAARGGDEKAQDRYQDVYTAFLEASRVVNASSAGYQQDFNYAQAMTEEAAKWAGDQVSVGQAQLAVLKAQVSSLVEIDKSVLSVRDAILQYTQAGGKPLAPQPVPVVTPYYPSEGRTNNVAALNAQLEALMKEVAGLRSDQRQQTGDQINAQAEAVADSAVEIGRALARMGGRFASNEERVFPE